MNHYRIRMLYNLQRVTIMLKHQIILRILFFLMMMM